MAEQAKRGGGRLSRELLFGATAILAYLAAAKVLVHLLAAGNYGYLRDELYYVAAGKTLQFGYADFPPFVALVAATRVVLGDSLTALHLPTVLAGAAVVVLAGLMARRLGRGRFAQGVAALALLVAPSFLVFGTWLSMDAFDQPCWVAAAYALIRILQGGRPELWLLFGPVVGMPTAAALSPRSLSSSPPKGATSRWSPGRGRTSPGPRTEPGSPGPL